MNLHTASTEEALAIVRLSLKTAQLNKTSTVIAALKGREWYAVAYKGSEGWCKASPAQQVSPLPSASFPAIPPTALEIYCALRGWAGGTIHGAVADLRQQGASFRDRLLDELCTADDKDPGVEMLLGA